MREMLYKAQALDGTGWVFGIPLEIFIKGIGRTFIIPYGVKCEKNTRVSEIQIEVDPKTVCQYTGLKDKDGNKIFEHDRGTYFHGTMKREYEKKVVFRCGRWELVAVCKYTCAGSEIGKGYSLYIEQDNFTRTGNIHDKTK